MTNDAPKLVTIATTAGMLCVGRSTIYDLIRKGELETVHIGRACRIETAAIERYVSRLRSSATPSRRS